MRIQTIAGIILLLVALQACAGYRPDPQTEQDWTKFCTGLIPPAAPTPDGRMARGGDLCNGVFGKADYSSRLDGPKMDSGLLSFARNLNAEAYKQTKDGLQALCVQALPKESTPDKTCDGIVAERTDRLTAFLRSYPPGRRVGIATALLRADACIGLADRVLGKPADSGVCLYGMNRDLVQPVQAFDNPVRDMSAFIPDLRNKIRALFPVGSSVTPLRAKFEADGFACKPSGATVICQANYLLTVFEKRFAGFQNALSVQVAWSADKDAKITNFDVLTTAPDIGFTLISTLWQETASK